MKAKHETKTYHIMMLLVKVLKDGYTMNLVHKTQNFYQT